jgi:GH24 family phage-related lysozyme (muramidase)
MGAADQFLVWNKIKDPKTGLHVPSITLTNRRKIERELFIKDIQQAA